MPTTDDKAPAFIMGCSRIGSLMTLLDDGQTVRLLRLAYDLGVRHFDTANVYGQGDSERFIARALGSVRNHICIASKAGLKPSAKHAVIRHFKTPLRWMLRSRLEKARATASGPAPAAVGPDLAAAIARRRAGGMGCSFEPDDIEASVAGSLRRLKTDHLDLFYLHSPPPSAMDNDALWTRLSKMQDGGRFARLGVSCDDFETAEAALDKPMVGVLQLDVDPGDRCAAILDAASRKGIEIHARGSRMRGACPGAGIDEVIGRLLRMPAVTGILMGTTSADHLRQNVAGFERATVATAGSVA